MTKKETVNRNIGLTFDFLRELIANPSLIRNLPDHCELEFIEKDFPMKKQNSLKNKYIVRVKSSFDVISKVAEPKPRYGKTK